MFGRFEGFGSEGEDLERFGRGKMKNIGQTFSEEKKNETLNFKMFWTLRSRQRLADSVNLSEAIDRFW